MGVNNMLILLVKQKPAHVISVFFDGLGLLGILADHPNCSSEKTVI